MRLRLATLGLVAFLLADLVLVFFALRPKADATPTPSRTSVAAGTQRPSTPTKTTTVSTGPTPLARSIVGLDAKIAVRATLGTCATGGSSFESTTDGGKTWTAGAEPVSSMTRIQPLDATRAFVIGAGRDCKPHQYTTTDLGQTWSGIQPIDGGWARSPAKANEVITPKVPAARPCGDGVVFDLSRTSVDQAEALCADGAVKVTNDGGVTWGDSGEAPGGLALSNRLEGGVLSSYVARINPDCPGVQIVTVIKGKDAQPVSCAPGTVPPGSGQISLSVNAQAGWLMVGNVTFLAPQELTSWKRV